jgi:hypothetical protein
MKTYMKFFMIIAIFFASCFMTGCQKEEVIDKSVEFLDLDISVLSSSEIQESDRLIIEAAKDRIDPYVTYEDGRYKISIKNGSQIHISDRLFQMYIDAIESSNQSLKELKSNTEVAIVQDVKDKKILHIVELKHFVRLKSDNPESPIPLGYSGMDWRWYGWDLYLTNKDASDFAYGLSRSSTAAYVTAAISGLCGSVGTAFVATIEGIYFGDLADRIRSYNNANGVIIRFYAGVPFVYTR